MTKVGVCKIKQASLELASKTIYCLLGSDSLWQPFPFNWCDDCKAKPTDVKIFLLKISNINLHTK